MLYSQREHGEEITDERWYKTIKEKVYHSLGHKYTDAGDYKKALEYWELFSIANDVGDKGLQACAYRYLGYIHSSLGDLETAMEYYQQCLCIAKDVGDKGLQASAYGNLGDIHSSLGDLETAMEYYQQCLCIAKDVGDKGLQARAYGNLGKIHFSLGDLETAMEYYQQCLCIAKDVGDKGLQASAYGNLGDIHSSLGDLETAMEYYQQCLCIAKDVGDKGLQARAYGNLGKIHSSLGDLETAMEYYQQCLCIAKDVGDKGLQAIAYDDLGYIHSSLGDLKTAMEYFQQCLCIAKDVGDKGLQASAYDHLGYIHSSLGDLKTAMEYYQQCLCIAKDVGGKGLQASAYGGLGKIHFSLGDLKTAMEYYQQCLCIAKDVGDKGNQGHAYGNLGEVHRSLGHFKTAMEYHQQCLSIAKDVGDKKEQGHAYGNLGVVHSSLGALEKAKNYYQQCLSIAKAFEDKVLQACVYCNLGIVYDWQGDLNTALEHYQQFLSISKDSGNKGRQAVAYFNLGQLYKKLNDLSKAENCFKSSVDMYNEIRDLLHSRDDWKISLRNEHRDAYNALWAFQLYRNKIIEALFSAERGRAQALMDLLKSKYDMELAQSSRSAENTEAISDILRYLPSQTVFLAIDESYINFWVLEKGKEIHSRKTKIDGNTFQEEGIIFMQSWIEGVCQKLRSVKFEDRCFDGSIVDEAPAQRSQETASLDGKKEALKKLYNKFIGPIADLLHGDEITIVPDGPLAFVPFSAVINQHSKYLSETFRIRLIPSLTSLKLMAECPEGYHSTTGALLVGDPRLGVSSVLINGRCTELPPLPWAKKEVEMIGEILNTKPLTGESATKAAVLSRINSVALVHIAAHGFPGTGEIILSPDPASSSGDFLLTMKDLLDSNLRARLVVLSCCHSGRGEIKAEGVVGIARAFLGAGARSVVVTLWAISDKATNEFMKHFYKHLSEGQPVSKCLHQARKRLRESDDFNDVSCWAPFVLIGDDVTINFHEIR